MPRRTISADLGNIERYIDKLSRLSSRELENLYLKALDEIAGRALRRVTHLTPIKTGTLKRSWKKGDAAKRNGEYQIEIFSNLEYAPYVEYGHRTRNHRGWVEGAFMLTLSIDEVEGEAPRIIENNIIEKLNEIFGEV